MRFFGRNHPYPVKSCMHKLGYLLDQDERPHYYPQIYEIEQTTGPQRLVVGATHGHVQLLRDLSRGWDGGVYLLYVLLHSRTGRPLGRYQSPAPLPRAQMELFLREFGSFLEQDGRHHLWLGAARGPNTLVYDQHNLIYAYGDLERYQAQLEPAGFHQAPVQIPAPHIHHYHADFDKAEERLFSWWKWTRFDLQPEDQPESQA